jgi:ribonuclease BN (tRNA processing enzyme)
LPSKHSSATDAAQVAKEAGAKQLAIVHGPLSAREKCLAAVAEIYDGVLVKPEPKMSIEI